MAVLLVVASTILAVSGKVTTDSIADAICDLTVVTPMQLFVRACVRACARVC